MSMAEHEQAPGEPEGLSPAWAKAADWLGGQRRVTYVRDAVREDLARFFASVPVLEKVDALAERVDALEAEVKMLAPAAPAVEGGDEFTELLDRYSDALVDGGDWTTAEQKVLAAHRAALARATAAEERAERATAECVELDEQRHGLRASLDRETDAHAAALGRAEKAERERDEARELAAEWMANADRARAQLPELEELRAARAEIAGERYPVWVSPADLYRWCGHEEPGGAPGLSGWLPVWTTATQDVPSSWRRALLIFPADRRTEDTATEEPNPDDLAWAPDEAEPYSEDCPWCGSELCDRTCLPAPSPATPVPDGGEPPVRCHDCGLPYSDPGFADLVVPNEVWAKISPTGDEGGLLCPTCMVRRAEKAGFDVATVPAQFRSGPFAVLDDGPVPAPAPQETVERTGGEASEADRLRAVIERDRHHAALGLNAVRGALASYGWLLEGRGSYEWDDDRWRDEFGRAVRKVHDALKPLAKIAADPSDSPATEEARRAALRSAPPQALGATDAIRGLRAAVVNRHNGLRMDSVQGDATGELRWVLEQIDSLGKEEADGRDG